MKMKISCNVIDDLMPSYIDEICSEDSCELIEEHVRTCKRCAEKLECMKTPIVYPVVKDYEEHKNPFEKIRRKNRKLMLMAVIITAVLVSGIMFAIQEVGSFHDFFYPSMRAFLESEVDLYSSSDENDWIQVEVDGKPYLNFDSVFYNKEIVNDANSSGDVRIRILDESKKDVLFETEIEAGTSVNLSMLKNDTNYIIQVKSQKGEYFLNII